MTSSKKLGLTITSLLLITALTILYSDGWRINLFADNDNNKKIDRPRIEKTGMLAVRSIPEGAKVYLDGKSITATDDTITSLKHGKYRLEVKKEGFETWAKEVEVFPELVTDITAVLVLQSPKLEPLTNTDVTAYAMAHNYNNIAYITKNHEDPGIWLLPLSGTPINLLKNDAKPLVEDNEHASPSLGEDLWWSPDDKEILVKMNNNGYLLYEIKQESSDSIPKPITNVNNVYDRWQKEYRTNFLNDKIKEVVKTEDFPKWLADDLQNYDSVWSPDENKFFIIKSQKYLKNNNEELQESSNTKGKSENSTQKENTKDTDRETNEIDVIVYNNENPLPVGEKRLTIPIKITNPDKTNIYWYSDSYHLIIVTENNDVPNLYTIELIRIDGTNRTTIYSGLLASNKAYPTPAGDKITVLTSLKENSPTNLYGISIR